MGKYKPQIYIDFYNIDTGEEVKVRRPAQIKAVIESSDMGVNKQSDRGWRIGKEWFNKLEAARTDRSLIRDIAKMAGGADKVTDTDILVAVYEREVEADIVRNSGRTARGQYEKEYRQMLEEDKEEPAIPSRPAQKK